MLRSLIATLLLVGSVAPAGLTAQFDFQNPVNWDTEIEALGNDEYNLTVIARLDDRWAIYSQFTTEGGPEPTTFQWADASHVTYLGKTTESGHRKEGMDDLFGVEVIKFLSDEAVVFTQRVRLTDYRPIDVTVTYMSCDDEQCLPPTDEEFTFDIPRPSATGTPDQRENNSEGSSAGLTNEVASEPKAATPSNNSTAAAPPRYPTQVGSSEVSAKVGSDTGSEIGSDTSEESASAERLRGAEPTAPIVAAQPPATEEDPVSWTLTATPTGAAGEYEITATANIEAGWSLYGYALDPEIGPVPTAFSVASEGVELLSDVSQEAVNRKVVYEDVWEAETPKLYDAVTYRQRVLAGPDAETIEGLITYMACKEVCLPPEDLPFRVDLTAGTATIGYPDELVVTDVNTVPDVFASACDLNFDNNPLAACNVGTAEVEGKSLWTIFGLGFIGGLFALLMPCIFPMIPLTVNFFNKGGQQRLKGMRNAGIYGLSIFLIYVMLSLPFHLVEGVDASILNQIASNVWLNVLFFAVFIFFAGNFFGFYELTLPSSWSNSSAKGENSGGLLGIFFMALTLALVSFSCTGPILGSLLVGTASEGAMPLTAGMAGFGLALALPFTVFAGFPQLLQSLPSSGGWLNNVKVVLGFVEVALAFKFLSTADLVGEWEFLKIELFYAIWILCFLGIAAYLMGFISFPLDSKDRKPGPLAYVVAATSLVIVGYLATGYRVNEELKTYQPLGAMSGLAPPVCHSFFYPCDCPQGIPCFKDLDEGLDYACKVGKPVMLDFTGYSCTNCRDMEENVWSQDAIRNTLMEDFVLISLYVDDRSELPADEVRVVDRLDRPGKTKTIDQVGEKWHYLEQSVYAKATQPYYVLISPDGKTLNPPVAYTPDVNEYAQFLACGLSAFRQLGEDTSAPATGGPTSELNK